MSTTDACGRVPVRSARALVVVLCSLTSGCATLTVSPDVPVTAAGPRLRGQLDFDGNADYLPDPIRALERSDSGPSYRYRYDVTYDDSDYSVLALINPLTLLGFPTGRARLTANGTLEVVRDGGTVKRYAARCVASSVRTIYHGDPLSELRGRALKEVARSISAQTGQDRDALGALTEEATAPTP